MSFVLLIPPSERKRPGGESRAGADHERTFDLPLPIDIATSASASDLKCTGARYEESIAANRVVDDLSTPLMPAIERYDGVVYRALDYSSLPETSQRYADEHLLIVSGIYGLLAPTDKIALYKLPCGKATLKNYWKPLLTNALIAYCTSVGVDTIVSLLPQVHQAMIDRQELRDAGLQAVSLSFVSSDGRSLGHHGKQTKGERLRSVCSQMYASAMDLPVDCFDRQEGSERFVVSE